MDMAERVETEAGFDADDFAHTAMLLRTDDDEFRDAVASNNRNIILAALDLAAATRPSAASVEPSAWGWYAGSDDERYTVGPEDSREIIIQAAKDEELGFHDADAYGPDRLCFEIVEARQDLLQIADYLRIDRMVERWEENDWEEMTDPDYPCSLVEKVTREQWIDLEVKLREVAREWQLRHAIVIKPYTFTQSRNHESIVIALEPEAQADLSAMREAYDITDPKHPDFAETMAARADAAREGE